MYLQRHHRFLYANPLGSECFEGNPNGSHHDNNAANTCHQVIKVARFGVVHPNPAKGDEEEDILKPPVVEAAPSKYQSGECKKKVDRLTLRVMVYRVSSSHDSIR